ncbi:rhodanese-related sulfurtransferase [Neolewinella xylanilytica]|uniref:Rhodanese-related sulfurtransferase n=1 Tax=Neolewinella xylanilytica TaxID=1514080 RepID=A0A2S6I6P1_9BACT|nr:rhodanese-like domain-containing protein [Neolewinella xylanilytica]PPK87140.1 rhodanese-related sulfurtransferase [Neolewinella xylanilytica]
MNRFLLFVLLLGVLACGQGTETDAPSTESPVPASAAPAYGQLSPAAFADKMEEEGVVLLDVRTPEEIAVGKIDGAVEMDYNDPDFAKQLATLEKGPTYLVYCASGGRSNKACTMMAEAGFEHVYNLEGGFTAWEQQ